MGHLCDHADKLPEDLFATTSSKGGQGAAARAAAVAARAAGATLNLSPATAGASVSQPMEGEHAESGARRISVAGWTLQQMREDDRCKVTGTGSVCPLCRSEVHCVAVSSHRELAFLMWYVTQCASPYLCTDGG
jgi:hypothetical protein